MTVTRLLIANRGEVAVRVIRTASEAGVHTVAVYSSDDAASLHVSLADEAIALPGAGPAAYLDIEALVGAAQRTKCDAVHPGWGFLSENTDFAQRCIDHGLTFVGPMPETLRAHGDKTRARAIAAENEVPILRGSDGPVTADEARTIFESWGGSPIVIKAIAGGGGRGMRTVMSAEDIADAYARCQSEAERAFGDGSLYVEEMMPRVRHIEIQVIGDGTGAVSHLYERDCSLQRRHQKVVEIAPSPWLGSELRERIATDAVRMASALSYRGLGTFEFLVDDNGRYAFIEANPRLQVEHTVTEEILGLDLVRLQLQIAVGETLAGLELDQPLVPVPRGMAMQLRLNTETITAEGDVLPAGGTLTAFQPPTGPGVRVDTAAYAGYTTSAAFDSLLAKVIVHTPTARFEDLIARAERALRDTHVAGVTSNVTFLRNLIEHPEFCPESLHTTFVDEHLADLARSREDAPAPPAAVSGHTAGARLETDDPLAVLDYGKSRPASQTVIPTGLEHEGGAVISPMQATVVSIAVGVGDKVRAGQEVAVLTAMKMEHVIRAAVSGVVLRVNAAPGDTIVTGQLLVFIEEGDHAVDQVEADADVDLDHIRPDLAEVLERRRRGTDEARADAVARRRASGQRTARENIEDLCDPDSFAEYGPLVLAAQRQRHSVEKLIEMSPADGMITGVGSINGELFGDPASRCVVLSYDYTVLAGTQGARNHAKTDRMIDVAAEGRMPLVLFAEGGGGRPGDTDVNLGPGAVRTFAHFPKLSGLVPMVGITSGRCFAGNASLLGCCDVIIATANSNIGMGGPAMVEGGGLGVFAPEDIGPMDVQVPNGVVDIAVADEAEAVAVAKRYLAYFQGPLAAWTAPDQRRMRSIVPENRLRVYDVRSVIDTLADEGTVLELRPQFGQGMVTALARVEGQPVGVIANDPQHLAGAITSDGSDKASRFMQVCDAFDIPLVFLCDTPGIMVGPEIEKTALVRHSSRMFVIGASVTVPCMTVILRKAYGLGAIAMALGSYQAPFFTVAWPTGEFGGMGLEGSVKLGYRKEIAAIEDPEERRKYYEDMVARAYERGKALNESAIFGIDDTIDPAETREWVARTLKSVRPPAPRTGKKRPAIDAW